MTKISFGMMVSLDGYIAGPEGGPSLPPPNEELHQYWNDVQKRTDVLLYGRRMYEVMRYWDSADTNPESLPVEVDFALAWQRTPKVVFSTTLTDVGPNARLVKENVREAVEGLKTNPGGNIEVAGAGLAATLSRLGLIDEYRLYACPVVLGGGKPFFEAGTSLTLVPLATEKLPQGVVLMRYRGVSAISGEAQIDT